MWILAVSLAHATGLPPRREVAARDAKCAATDTVDGTLVVTDDMISGSCAPGGPCSRIVMESLDPRELVLKLHECDEPLPGRFVRAGTCDGVPSWRWRGELHPGRRHVIGIDGGSMFGTFLAAGEAVDADWCPVESVGRNHRRTEVTISPASPHQFTAFPEEGYAVVPVDEGARIVWTPGPSLAQWALQSPDATLQSEVLSVADAERRLAETTREPTGLSVRYQVTGYREHHEGYDKRGFVVCERVLVQELAMTLLPSETVLTGEVTLREPAASDRCPAP